VRVLLTMTIASAAMETMWTRLMGFGVDTLWALKRLASSRMLSDFVGGSERV
jgi:hypothetical protein